MGTLIGIVIVLAFISAAIEGMAKPRRHRRHAKNESGGNGCLIAIAIIFLLGAGSVAINFVKVHITAFIIGGIILTLIILFCYLTFHSDPKEIELQKRANEIKQQKNLHFQKKISVSTRQHTKMLSGRCLLQQKSQVKLVKMP